MVIFNSYVSLPDGTSWLGFDYSILSKTTPSAVHQGFLGSLSAGTIESICTWYKLLPVVVPRKAVAEVSRIGNL